MDVQKELILITGATGYVAAHIVKMLAVAGEYRLRCTVRSLENNKKLDSLKEAISSCLLQPEFVAADLMQSPEEWKEVVAGCDYVLHTASPFPASAPSNDDEVIKPAVEGTLSVLKACADSGTVKRVVVTSSCAAIYAGNSSTMTPLTEEIWANVENIKNAYSKSKPLAEKAAWDFVNQLPEDKKLELVVINPGMVLGPPVFASESTSITLCKSLLTRAWPMVPKTSFPAIDVRDVAQAHINAIKTPEAAGHRHILANGTYWFKELAVLLADEFNSKGFHVPTTQSPSALIYLKSLWDAEAKTIKSELGNYFLFDNSRMKNVLNIDPKPIKDSIIEMGHALIDLGIVPKPKQNE